MSGKVPARTKTPDRATEFAHAVVHGKRVAGELMVAAAKRHLDDLREGAARGLHWDREQAEQLVASFPAYFSITDGPKAGAPFELLDWMAFAVGGFFGWRRENGTMRFNECDLETGKGSGKSPLMAATALLACGAMNRARAEIYCGAPREAQARVMFRDAAAMVRAPTPMGEDGETLESRGVFMVRGRLANAHRIEHPRTASFMMTTSGQSTKTSGPRPFGVFLDEIHELPDRALIDMWLAAIVKTGGFMWRSTNCPALDQPVGSEIMESAARVALGHDANDARFVVMCRVDVADRARVFDRPKTWAKAMPSLGITFDPEAVEREVVKARLNPADAARVKRLYFGIPTGTETTGLADPDLWDAALGPLPDSGTLAGCPCFAALDLSMRHDLSALAIGWALPHGHPSGRRLAVRLRYWTVERDLAARSRRDRMNYEAWGATGQLTVVPGATIDKEMIALELQALAAANDLRFLAYDVALMAAFEEACGRIGFPVWRYQGPDKPAGYGLKLVAHAQGPRMIMQDKQLCMPRSIDGFDELMRKGELLIEPNPVTTACMAAAEVRSDALANRYLDKRRRDGRGRIDGAVALVMVVGAALMAASEPAAPEILVL